MADPSTRPTEPQLATDVEIHTPDATANIQPAPDAELDRELGGGAARELARAFQANAEALAGMHEIQASLADALKRGDRSEMVLQSTQALNDTFRNLSSIQRQMLTQMQEQETARRKSPLVPVMLLGLLVVLLGGVYLIVDQLRKAKPSHEELATLRKESERGRLEAYREGQNRGIEEAGRRVQALQDEIDQSRLRTQALEGERDAARGDVEELERAKRGLENERDDLAERVLKSRNDAMARELVEERVHEQKAELIVAQERVKLLEKDLERERAERLRLLKQMASMGLGLDEEPLIEVRYPGRDPEGDSETAGPSTPDEMPELDTTTPPTGPGMTPSSTRPDQPTALPAVSGSDGGIGDPPTARPGDLPAPRVRSPGEGAADSTTGFPPPTADGAGTRKPARPVPVAWRRNLNTDQVLGGRVRSIVNERLAVGARTTKSQVEWQLTKLGGVGQDVLADILLIQYDTTGRIVGSVQAEQLRIVTLREKKLVEFHLRNGKRSLGGKSEALPEGGARLVVAAGEAQIRIWRDSGLLMVDHR